MYTKYKYEETGKIRFALVLCQGCWCRAFATL